MPYIETKNKEKYNKVINLIVDEFVRISIHSNARMKGELNFIITAIIKRYLGRTGANYSAMNDMIGVLECCKLELYRRVVAEYENKKIEINGDAT